ncbi:MAG: coenzyme synthetase [Proteobacteria bacterium]|jgi:phenylacetate-CoA ligase|nr:coenzyme synthetase [Pseudomonadota bacterium]
MPIGTKAHILQDPEGQRRFQSQSLEATRQLHDFSKLADPLSASLALGHFLPGLGDSLLRSSYYADCLQRMGLAVGDLTELADLRHFPTLDRSTLSNQWNAIPCFDPAAPDAGELVVIKSSGTTGDPVRVVRNRYDCLHMWAVLRFWAQRLGIDIPHQSTVVLLCSLPSGMEYEAQVPIFDNAPLKRISICCDRPGERLVQAAPRVLFSDPAGLHWLAHCGSFVTPDLVLTSAQHFSAASRKQLANVVDAPVINYYAITEVGPIAWECPDSLGHFHVLTPDVYVEEDGGELLVTRLRPGLFPMLRYRTGDAGTVVFEACGCGFSGWSIVEFSGREQCLFCRPDGEEVDAWQLAWVFKHHSLRSFKLVQTGSSNFELFLIETADGVVERLQRALVVLGWENPGIKVCMGPLGARGDKPRSFEQAS